MINSLNYSQSRTFVRRYNLFSLLIIVYMIFTLQKMPLLVCILIIMSSRFVLSINPGAVATLVTKAFALTQYPNDRRQIVIDYIELVYSMQIPSQIAFLVTPSWTSMDIPALVTYIPALVTKMFTCAVVCSLIDN